MKSFSKTDLKPLLVIVPLVILIPLITGFVLNLPLGKYTIGDENAWVAFHGSYIGGVTGGLVAYFIARMQINQLRRETELNHLRFYAAIERDISFLKNQLPSLKHHLEYGFHAYYKKRNAISNEYTRERQLNDLHWNLDVLNSIHSGLTDSVHSLQSFALSDIPPRIALEFHSLLRIAGVFDNQISQFTRNEKALLNFLETKFDFDKMEIPNKLEVALADNGRISQDIQTHITYYEEKVKIICDSIPKEKN